MIKHNGADATENWAKGIVANSRAPQGGGDTDRSAPWLPEPVGGDRHHYYLARLMNSGKPEDQARSRRSRRCGLNQRPGAPTSTFRRRHVQTRG